MKIRVLVFSIAAVLVLVLVDANVAARQQDSNGKNVVALINGSRVITQKEIDEAAGSPLYDLEEKVYKLRKKALENLVIQVLLADEAKKRGLTEAELRRQLIPSRVDVKQSDIDTTYASNLGILENMNEDEAKQRIRLDLETRLKLDAYKTAISEIVSKGKIETFLNQPIPPSPRLTVNGPSIGPLDAPVTVVEFSDFQCPYCRQAAVTLKPLIKSYGNNVRFVFKQMPLPIHAEAFKAAQASVCAGEQGKFWEYHDILFRSNDLSEPAITRYASEIGLETAAFNSCLSSEASAKVVRMDMEEAVQAGVQGTPTYFVNGRIIKGIKSAEDFKVVIDQALGQKHRNVK